MLAKQLTKLVGEVVDELEEEDWKQEYLVQFRRVNGYSCLIIEVDDNCYQVVGNRDDLSDWTKDELIGATNNLKGRFVENETKINHGGQAF